MLRTRIKCRKGLGGVNEYYMLHATCYMQASFHLSVSQSVSQLADLSTYLSANQTRESSGLMGCCILQYSTIQYSTVQYSTVQCSAVQYSTVQYNTVQYSTV